MEKTAYEIGVSLALEDAGLLKNAQDTGGGIPWGLLGGAALLGGGLGVRSLAKGLRGKGAAPAFKKWQSRGGGAPTAGRSTGGPQFSAGPRTPGVVRGGSSYSSSAPTRQRIH